MEGKRALVLGGTSGLGRSIAIGLAEAGTNVVPVGRRAQAVCKVADEIRQLGRTTLEVIADVTTRADIQKVVDCIVEYMGRIDILVNSAGITMRVSSLDMNDEDWDRIIDTNVRGMWLACQIGGRQIKGQMYGRIINIASIDGFHGLPKPLRIRRVRAEW